VTSAARNEGSIRRLVRQAVAEYMHSEGCSCCRSEPEHSDAAARLAKLLRVPKYKDGSGYDFMRFRAKPNMSVRVVKYPHSIYACGGTSSGEG
jgi:hypothetical protein